MQPIVFVIGAGASQEVNLPTGQELKRSIIEILPFSMQYYGQTSDQTVTFNRAIELHCSEPSNRTSRNINDYFYAAETIRTALPLSESIDNFVDTHSGDHEIELSAKLAITLSILIAESKSKIPLCKTVNDNNSGLNFGTLENTWFTPFFRLLIGNRPIDELPERFSNVTLIVFNYDRCIEQFFFHALQAYYAIPPDIAADLVTKINIYHPYGNVGSLPWYRSENSNDAIAFGQIPDPQKLLSLSKQIRTFTEGTDPSSSQILQIHEKIVESRMMIFLGFGYHSLNLNLLTPLPEHFRSGFRKRLVYGTSSGLSDSDKDETAALLVGSNFAIHEQIRLRDVFCLNLFHEFSRAFSTAFE